MSENTSLLPTEKLNTADAVDSLYEKATRPSRPFNRETFDTTIGGLLEANRELFV